MKRKWSHCHECGHPDPIEQLTKTTHGNDYYCKKCLPKHTCKWCGLIHDTGIDNGECAKCRDNREESEKKQYRGIFPDGYTGSLF